MSLEAGLIIFALLFIAAISAYVRGGRGISKDPTPDHEPRARPEEQGADPADPKRSWNA